MSSDRHRTESKSNEEGSSDAPSTGKERWYDGGAEPAGRHLGGGRKGVLLLLRYVYIIAASYLLIFASAQKHGFFTNGVMIAAALASNIALSLVPERLIFSWFVEAPVLVGDTLWVAWALHSTGPGGDELFLLYFFVLFLAVVGENILLVVLSSTAVSAAEFYLSSRQDWLTSTNLLHLAFFYAVALFFGYVIGQIKRERQRADRGIAWAKELEEMVAERTIELSRLYKESLAASRLKSEFLATMSHELRTPLHIIMGYAEMLKDREGSISAEERTWILDRLLKAASGQYELVTNVLNLSRVEAGRMPVDRDLIEVEALVTGLMERERPPLAEGVRLEWMRASDLGTIETDVEKLSVILENLINNAIKFTAAGQIRISARDRPDHGQIEFSVEDTGPGIDADEIPTIFESFRQVDGSLSRRHGGVGLGLAIVDRYARLLGARVDVRSELGRGTHFSVRVPRQGTSTPQSTADPLHTVDPWLQTRTAAQTPLLAG
ncbi:MAG: HAMP domain-containing histidine kinase [Deltaproteobacteria bacterium]|nr:HAMP domain-containing histidine kinase [Deltaproteobacteria bacterium]